jgi:hypothetical protein
MYRGSLKSVELAATRDRSPPAEPGGLFDSPDHLMGNPSRAKLDTPELFSILPMRPRFRRRQSRKQFDWPPITEEVPPAARSPFLVYVDHNKQKRMPKLSAKHFRETIAKNGVVWPPSDAGIQR